MADFLRMDGEENIVVVISLHDVLLNILGFRLRIGFWTSIGIRAAKR